MSTTTPVPSDVEPTSLMDLVNDCREVAGVLGSTVIDLTRPMAGPVADAVHSLARVPLSRIPLDRLPVSFGLLPAEITEDALHATSTALDGYGDYGS